MLSLEPVEVVLEMYGVNDEGVRSIYMVTLPFIFQGENHLQSTPAANNNAPSPAGCLIFGEPFVSF
mgnify:CR=1 FL=1